MIKYKQTLRCLSYREREFNSEDKEKDNIQLSNRGSKQ